MTNPLKPTVSLSSLSWVLLFFTLAFTQSSALQHDIDHPFHDYHASCDAFLAFSNTSDDALSADEVLLTALRHRALQVATHLHVHFSFDPPSLPSIRAPPAVV